MNVSLYYAPEGFMSPQTRILYNDLPSAVNEIVLEVYRHLKYISWFSILSLKSMKVLYPRSAKIIPK